MQWDLSTRERWEQARVQGRAGWTVRQTAPLLLTCLGTVAALGATKTGEQYWPWILGLMVVAVATNAFILAGVYAAAAAKFTDAD